MARIGKLKIGCVVLVGTTATIACGGTASDGPGSAGASSDGIATNFGTGGWSESIGGYPGIGGTTSSRGDAPDPGGDAVGTGGSVGGWPGTAATGGNGGFGGEIVCNQGA